MPGKILIIDRDQEAQKRVASLLEKEAYEVITAANGIEGLKKAEDESPDLVILEVLLPGLDGYEVCHRLRTQAAQLPIIILSARSGERARVTGLRVGADDYIAKSGENELVARVNRLLAQKKASPKATGASARIFGFFGTRGGAGTTTIAVNVAVALAQQKKRVALVDLCPSIDPSTSPLSRLMGVRCEAEGYFPVVTRPEENSGSTPETHETGVKILTYSALMHDRYGDPSPEDIDATVEELGPQHDYVIMDMPPYYSSALKRGLLKCHRVILVAPSGPHAVRMIKSAGDFLNGLGLRKERLAMVVNIGSTLGEASPSTTELGLTSSTDIPLLGVIPHSGHAQEWEARGVPLVVAEPDGTTSLALLELARRLIRG